MVLFTYVEIIDDSERNEGDTKLLPFVAGVSGFSAVDGSEFEASAGASVSSVGFGSLVAGSAETSEEVRIKNVGRMELNCT